MRLLMVVMLAALAGCAPTVDATELGGVVNYTTTPGGAIQAANAHCQKYGRVARATQISHYTGYVTFSCERPDRS
jgi:hypothetical protein